MESEDWWPKTELHGPQWHNLQTEKSIQREKNSRLLAEKTSELAGKQLACVEQKNKNQENQLKNAETKAKDAEVKVEDKARKRIVAELELVDQR